MDENLKDFVEALGEALVLYSRERVEGITYRCEGANEYADIDFTDGGTERVVISGDSCTAAMIDIARALI
jgi:hypothetical protein